MSASHSIPPPPFLFLLFLVERAWGRSRMPRQDRTPGEPSPAQLRGLLLSVQSVGSTGHPSCARGSMNAVVPCALGFPLAAARMRSPCGGDARSRIAWHPMVWRWITGTGAAGTVGVFGVSWAKDRRCHECNAQGSAGQGALVVAFPTSA